MPYLRGSLFTSEEGTEVVSVNTHGSLSDTEALKPEKRSRGLDMDVLGATMDAAKNFGAVQKDAVYRSGFPLAHNIGFMEKLHLRSILTLVTEEKNAPSSTYKDFIATRGINHKVVLIEPNKDGAVNTNLDKLCEAILFVLSPQNHPVYIHCNQGKHRTGCVVACLRLCQQWPIDEVLEEYLTYARGKEREGDIALIKSFDPSLVFDYAKTHNMLDSFDTRERVDSFTNIFHLASNLPAHNIALLDDKDRSSELSEVSDETLEIYRSHSWYPETITRDFIRSSLRGTQSSASSITESTVSSLSASETGADHDVSPMSLTDPVDNSPATAGDSMRTID